MDQAENQTTVKPDSRDGACRVCGRSSLPHPSGACRSCRRRKPESWTAPARAPELVPTPILSAAERATEEPKGWREVSRRLWKRPGAPPG